MEEIWKDVIGYKGLYQVSNLGRVKSLDRWVKSKHNSIKMLKSKPMIISTDIHGYQYITLSKNGIRIKHKIHRLVAKSFIRNLKNKPEVNHKNGIKNDNRAENLEWATSSENQKHAYITGLQVSKNYLRTGINNRNSKPVLKYTISGEFMCEYECTREAADFHNVTSSSISEACRKNIKIKGYLWKYK